MGHIVSKRGNLSGVSRKFLNHCFFVLFSVRPLAVGGGTNLNLDLKSVR